ncbi:ribosome silencing factor [bacterium]|nr:ribosome silencing factor [bacterium]
MKKPTSLDFALFCKSIADEKKAEDIVILELPESLALADYFLIMSGTNKRHVKSLADEIAFKAKQEFKRNVKIEGYESSTWMILDFKDVVIHVFEDEVREFYDLEGLWKECKRV